MTHFYAARGDLQENQPVFYYLRDDNDDGDDDDDDTNQIEVSRKRNCPS